MKKIEKRLNRLLEIGQTHIKNPSILSRPDFISFRTQCLSFISNIYSNWHPYYVDFEKHVVYTSVSDQKIGIEVALAILKGIENEIENNWVIKMM